MLSLKSSCSHFCHSPYKSLCHITYACPSHKTPPTRFSVFVTESEARSSLSKENQSQSASVSACVCFQQGSQNVLGSTSMKTNEPLQQEGGEERKN